MNEPELNYRARIIWDNMTTVVENGVEVERVYTDNKLQLDLTAVYVYSGDQEQ